MSAQIQQRLKCLVIAYLLCWLPCTIHAQNVENLWSDFKGKIESKIKELATPPSLSGSINANSTFNHISGIPRRTQPFSSTVAVNLNLKVSKFSMPFSWTFSNGRTTYNYAIPDLEAPEIKLPSFNFAGLSPQYKWATLHLGNRSMTFSPYTLSGHSFYGIGIELKPKKYEFSAMYGRLQRAVAEDFNALHSLDPTYRRMGWGFKAGYNGDAEKIHVILFQGWDDETSIPRITNNPALTPAENTVMSIIGEKKFGKVVSLSVDYARSGLTQDVTSEEVTQGINFAKRFGGLYTPKVSSGYYNAIKTTLGFKTKVGDFSLDHEWVDPGYRTLGALFFNNDFENWTIGTMTALFNKKVTLGGNAGVQRNNLRGTELNTSRRFVGALNMTVMPSDKMNINIAYSNFQNTNKLRATSIPFVQVDSLILSQVNQSASFGVSYLAGKEKNAVTNLMLSYQNANSIENDEVQADQKTTNYMANLMQTYIFSESKLSLTASILANYSLIPNLELLNLSPTLAVSKPFLDNKMKTSLSASYVAVATNGNFDNTIISTQGSVQYTFLEKHNLALNIALVNRQVMAATAPVEPFTEVVGGVNYSWSFNAAIKKK